MNRESPPPRAAASSLPSPVRREERGGAQLRLVLPPHAPGMRIGLFGGTFDPVHAAHRAACLLALKRLALDRVWWLVTPGNPLKNTRGLAPLAIRLAAARKLAHHPRIDVTDLEAQTGDTALLTDATRFGDDRLGQVDAQRLARCDARRQGGDGLGQQPFLFGERGVHARTTLGHGHQRSPGV